MLSRLQPPPVPSVPVFAIMYGNRNSGYDVVLYRPDINEYWGLVADGALTGSVPGEDELWTCWVSGGRFYIIGGRDDGTSIPSLGSRTVASIPLPTTWRDATYSATWTNHGLQNRMVTNGQYGMWAAVSEGFVVIAQGADRGGPSLNESDHAHKVLESSLPTNNWIANVGTVTEERNGTINHAAVGNDGLIYFGSGTTIGSVADVDFHSRDPTTDANDDTLADMPEARIWGAFASDGDYIYAAGGRNSGSSLNLASVDRYNISTDTWEAMPDMPASQAFTPAFVHDGFLYRFTFFSGTIYRYDLTDGLSGVWESISPTNPDGLPANWPVFVTGAATGTIGNTFTIEGP